MNEQQLTVRVDCSRPAVGTLQWLIENAALVQIGDRLHEGGSRRHAILLDRQGRQLAALAVVEQVFDHRERTLKPERRTCNGEGGHIPWSDAAVLVLGKLAALASPLLDEPACVGEVVKVKLAPVDPLAEQLLRAARNDPLAKRALHDRVLEAPVSAAALSHAETEPPVPCNGQVQGGSEDEIPF
jgi:hypothetical protein